ncbi:VOC family protein [Candidatus Binatus sp.]|uniref:VOC family protein n=1 Tax=Candidatus Binatus sp. TaxID=2811406 RepID=UPI003C894EC7
MAIVLDHTIVPARDKVASAKYFAKLFGLSYDGPMGPFAPVRVNGTLTMDFDDRWENFGVHHYAFHVSEEEFDAIFGRIKKEGLSYGSQPWSLGDMKVDESHGGRVVYFFDLANHVLEIRTKSSAAAMAEGA